MRKIGLMLILFFTMGTLSAQPKSGYIYSQKVFESIPAYVSAEQQLKTYAETGTQESKDKLQRVKEMYEEFNKYQSQMSSSQRERYKQMIIEEEEKANKYQEEYFGEDGVMSKQQQLLLKPIEEKVQQAVTRVAEREGYGMVFDLSLVKVTVYQSAAVDLTYKVMEELKNSN